MNIKQRKNMAAIQSAAANNMNHKTVHSINIKGAIILNDKILKVSEMLKQ